MVMRSAHLRRRRSSLIFYRCPPTSFASYCLLLRARLRRTSLLSLFAGAFALLLLFLHLEKHTIRVYFALTLPGRAT
jgi:hypothetical protein